MKRSFISTMFLGVLIMSAGLLRAQYTWNGSVSEDWSNTANWNGGAKAPDNDTGTPILMPAKSGAANNLRLNNDKRTPGITIQDAWTIYVNGKTLRADWITVDFASGNGTAVIEGGNNFQSYNNFTWNAATGDTLLINCYYKPVGSNNRYNTINGGGTVILNNSIDHDNKQMNFTVSGGTTFVNNHWIGTLSAGSITVNSDSRYAGDGNTGVATTTINGTISPSTGGNADSGVGTLNFVNALVINGTYAADVTASTCDKVACGALTLGANSKLVVSGTTQAKVYEIATYTSLSGTFTKSTSVLPEGYMLDYAYDGANTIALVKLGGTVILVK